MNEDRQVRYAKLGIAFCAFPLWAFGAMTHYGVATVGGNLLDAFRVNWISYSFCLAGGGAMAIAIIGWLRLGLKQRRNASSNLDPLE